MPTAMSTETEVNLNAGLLWTVGDTTSVIASGGNVLYGLRTGVKPVIYMNRAYTSASTRVHIELFENTFTGGTPVNAKNRNFTNLSSALPALHFRGVTGTPSGTPVAEIVLQGGGLLAGGLGISPESEWYMVKPNTDYILRISNDQLLTGADVTFRFTFKNAM